MRRKTVALTHHPLLITHHCFKSASDEMNNLDAVAFREFGLRPVGAADDFAITLDGEARRHERELIDEFAERRARLDFAALAVDLDAQTFSTSTWKGE